MRRQSKARWVFSVMAPWAFNVMAPWALGVGLLVSFTADAGQGSAGDWNVAPLTARARATAVPAAFQLASFGEVATGEFGFSGQTRALVQSARLMVGAPDDLRSIPDEREPQVDLKPDVKNFPEVDRTRKGDPLVAMRPGFETRRVIDPATLGLAEPARLTFHIRGKPAAGAAVVLAPRGQAPGDEALYEAEAAKVEALSTTQTQKSAAAASPSQGGSKATSRAAAEPSREPIYQAMSERALHGATPQVSRAVALSSSSPAQPDALPVEVSSFPRAMMALANAGKAESGARPDYASLVSPDNMDREKRCLAEAVYFESRSEPEAGQAAVAQVVLNRVQSGLYPSSICGVVYQNRRHYRACQFSFACEGKSLRITEPEAWATAARIADEVMEGRTYISDVGRSTHYHANYVKPRWARALTKMDMIGRHIFYRLKPGQT